MPTDFLGGNQTLGWWVLDMQIVDQRVLLASYMAVVTFAWFQDQHLIFADFVGNSVFCHIQSASAYDNDIV
ncbi:hypothetical protein GCM10008018_26770 [Paenibacillus marchantiophytorum]|uniref:Uncharacterized protein n=1 Tax=Paenibacillus marchantiophytorum TaxID=1619310 RepID=A0ABQ1ENF8_9BACL|nr:hypothetical protein GCM10008018_26770 [Paenibacillus marchantiophytorum]